MPTLGEVIKDSLQMEYWDEPKRDYIGISQLGYCELRTMKEYQAIEKQPQTYAMLMQTTMGRLKHEKMHSLLWKYRKYHPDFRFLKSEQELVIVTPAGNRLCGHSDLLFKMNGGNIVGDYKFCKPEYYNHLKRTNHAPEYYIDQLNLYSLALGVKTFDLAFVAEVGESPLEFIGEIDQERVKKLLEKYDRIIAGKAVKPFKDTREGGFQCKDCINRSECWPEEEGIQKSEEVIQLSLDIEMRLMEIDNKLKTLLDERESLKDALEAELDGKKGVGMMYDAIFVSGASGVDYDKKKLEAYVPLALLEKCKVPKTKAGSFQIRRKKTEAEKAAEREEKIRAKALLENSESQDLPDIKKSA